MSESFDPAASGSSIEQLTELKRAHFEYFDQIRESFTLQFVDELTMDKAKELLRPVLDVAFNAPFNPEFKPE